MNLNLKYLTTILKFFYIKYLLFHLRGVTAPNTHDSKLTRVSLCSANNSTQKRSSDQFSSAAIVTLCALLSAYCLAWPNAHSKFVRTREQAAEQRHTFALCSAIWSRVRSP